MDRCGKFAEGSDECLTHPGRNCSVLKDKCNGLTVGASCTDWYKATNKELKPGTDVANTQASGGGSPSTRSMPLSGFFFICSP